MAEVKPHHYDVLRRPLITEKSTLVAEHNKIVFEVAITADKKSIKEAVEALFKVDVTAVNTVLQKGKTKRFKAAVVSKPVINWFSFALTSDMKTTAARYWFAKMPWEDPDTYFKYSPISLVGNVETPTMVVVGENDYRTWA